MHRRNSTVVVSILMLVLSASLTAAQDRARMEKMVDSFAATGFTGAVLVAKADDVWLSKGWGSANLEWGIPITPSTRFRIASITKQFTAAAILLLEERGRLSVSDPIRAHLTDMPAAWDAITIFHLLTQTSGIPDYSRFPAQSIGPLTPVELLARFRDQPLEFAPGERFSYSNSGYAVLGYLIERISGTSYAQFLRDNIFAALGMNDSGYDSSAEIIRQRAAGYRKTASGPYRNATYLDTSVPYAAGGLFSTTEDLLKWNRALFGGKLLSAASLKKMTTPVMNSYGFGLNVQSVRGRTTIFYAGGINGFTTVLAYYPESQVTIAVLANVADAGDGIVAGLSALVHGEDPDAAQKR